MNQKPTRQPRAGRQTKRAVAASAVIAAVLAIGAAASAGVAALPQPAATGAPLAPSVMETGGGPQAAPASGAAGPEGTVTEASKPEIARGPQPVSPPVPLNATVAIAQGAKIRISAIETVQGEARLPGEVAGPSLRFQVVIDNPTNAEIPTNNMLVNLESGSESKPAVQLSGPGVVGFTGPVAPRSSASAVFVFNVAPAERDRIRILFDYGVTDPIAVFEGSAGKAGA